MGLEKLGIIQLILFVVMMVKIEPFILPVLDKAKAVRLKETSSIDKIGIINYYFIIIRLGDEKQILLFIFCLICTLVNVIQSIFYSFLTRNDLPVFQTIFLQQ